MISIVEKHLYLTETRVRAYKALFGDDPIGSYPYYEFASKDTPCMIDVLVYSLRVGGLEVPAVAVVTNGMSDFRLTNGDQPEPWVRRELIQYLKVDCDKSHACWLHNVAWLPHFDKIFVDVNHTVAWPRGAVSDSEWHNSLLLKPYWNKHRDFTMRIEGDDTSLLWHIPLTDAELDWKKTHGIQALVQRMDQVGLPWLFDEENRPSLILDEK